MIVAISSAITLIGLWLVLRKYLSVAATVLALLVLALGTNFFLMTIYSGAIQASILLALMVLVVWMTQRWNDKPGWTEAVIIGLAAGTQVFIKTAGFASILVFIFWNAYNRETFRAKWELWRYKAPQVVLIFLLFAALLGARLAFPQALEDTWFNDYVQHMRAFYFLAPNLWLVMFSIKNGWLIYTPIALLSIPGFYILAERNKPLFYASFLYCLVFTLMLASSPNVHAPTNFSQARMTEIFAMLLLPLGYFASWVLEGGLFRRSAFILIIFGLISLNLFQTWQYRSKILNPWFTTPEYYCSVFLKTQVTDEDRAKMDFNNMDESSWLANEPMDVKTLAYQDFEQGEGGFSGHVTREIAMNGKGSFRLDTGLRFTPTFSVKLKELPQKSGLGIRTTVNVYSPLAFTENPACLVITLQHEGALYRYKTLELGKLNPEPGKWHEVKMDYVIPRIWDPEDVLITHLWYQGNKAMYADDVKVELFEPRGK